MHGTDFKFTSLNIQNFYIIYANVIHFKREIVFIAEKTN